VTLGSTLFGITGAFLAVPFVATVAVVLRYLDEVVTERAAPGLRDPEPETVHEPHPDAEPTPES
jgi:putative heme transporter